MVVNDPFPLVKGGTGCHCSFQPNILCLFMQLHWHLDHPRLSRKLKCRSFSHLAFRKRCNFENAEILKLRFLFRVPKNCCDFSAICSAISGDFLLCPGQNLSKGHSFLENSSSVSVLLAALKAGASHHIPLALSCHWDGGGMGTIEHVSKG